MADKSRTIKGQAYVQPFKLEDGTIKRSLVQEQILLLPNGNNSSNTIVLIDDIWEDLKKDEAESQYKTNGKGYFYWEYKMTDTSTDTDIDIKLDCPKPDYGVFEEPYDPDSVTGSYSKFWVERLKTSTDNYERSAAIQRKEVTLEGSTYIDQNGEQVTINSTKITNSDLGDLTNLISLF